jgi:gliding motility-associated-like protein
MADTLSIKIISHPDDTTINVKFLKPFNGYMKAQFDGCVLKDSLHIIVNSPQWPPFLGNDTTLCYGEKIILNAGKNFKSYQWQDGSDGTTFKVNKAGTYFVMVLDTCGNYFSDTINIKEDSTSLNLLHENNLCNYDTALVSLNQDATNYKWSPQDEAIIANNVLKLFPSATTTFNLSAKSSYGCLLDDTLLIKVIQCPEYFYMPNAFTPNHNGLNDLFKPTIAGKLEKYHLLIYNRYGQLLFSSNDLSEGWDGRFNGIEQASGVYVWVCSYKFFDKEAVQKKGSVVLIK